MSPPASLSASPLLAIKETTESGRGVYAATSIPKDTLLLETDHLAAKIVYREYRKEVCAQCFKYDGGRNLPFKNPSAAIAFCGKECQDVFEEEDASIGGMRTLALQAMEGLKGKVTPWLIDNNNDQSPRPTREQLLDHWIKAEETATRILTARSSAHPSKSHRRALADALLVQPVHDILGFLLSGILCVAYSPDLWNDILELESNTQPYVSVAALEMHICSYHHLLAACPPDLLPFITSTNLRLLAEKSSHNVFNLWSQDLLVVEGDGAENSGGGSECLGYGLFPRASYFNHSCAPNVRKKREGRMWRFWTDEDVGEGDMLCITYLGGDEKDMRRGERMGKLKGLWGFDCGCVRCEDGAGGLEDVDG